MIPILSIAGSDCSGGAGIQADIKTISACKMYAMSVITAVTAQNTLGVQAVSAVSAEMVSKQIDSVFADIVPKAVKIGMLCNAEIVMAVAERLKYYKAENVVIDPVMLSTSGRALLDDKAVEIAEKELFPMAALLTPNIPEAMRLSGMEIRGMDSAAAAAAVLKEKYGCAVLIKGGHGRDGCNDLLLADKEYVYRCAKIENPNTHGTGCTLSSAIACGLGKGLSLPESVRLAKAYITGAIKDGMKIGHGSGPLNHFWEK